MKSYSLLEAVYTKSDPIDLVDPSIRLHALAEKFWQSPYGIHEIQDFATLQCEGDLLLEFSLGNFIKDNLANVFQAAIGAALEAGITVGTVGVGAPAAPVAEFMNDAVFFGISAGDALASIKNVASEVGEMKDAVKEMLSISISNTPQQIYDKVKKVINKLGGFFKKIKVPVEKGIEKLKELYRKLMTKIAKVAGDTIALFSPIPGTDAIVQNGIAEFADDAFKLMIKVYDKIPDFLKQFIQSPAKMKETLQAGLKITVEFLEKMKNSEPKSFMDSLKTKVAGAVLGPVGNLLKSDMANKKIISFLKEKGAKAIDFVVKAVGKIIPVLWGAGSALTVLVNDDHDLLKKGKNDKSSGGSKTPNNKPSAPIPKEPAA